jgi:hypothetical protein
VRLSTCTMSFLRASEITATYGPTIITLQPLEFRPWSCNLIDHAVRALCCETMPDVDLGGDCLIAAGDGLANLELHAPTTDESDGMAPAPPCSGRLSLVLTRRLSFISRIGHELYILEISAFSSANGP